MGKQGNQSRKALSVAVFIVICAISSGTANVCRVGVVYTSDASDWSLSRLEFVLKRALAGQFGECGLQEVTLLHVNSSSISDQVSELSGKSVHGIVSPVPDKKRGIIEKLSKKLCLPYIAIGAGLLQSGEDICFPTDVISSFFVPNRLVLDIVNHIGWKHIGVLPGQSVDVYYLQDLIFRMSEYFVDVTLVTTDYVWNDTSAGRNLPDHMIFLGSVHDWRKHKDTFDSTQTSIWIVITDALTKCQASESLRSAQDLRLVVGRTQSENTCFSQVCQDCAYRDIHEKVTITIPPCLRTTESLGTQGSLQSRYEIYHKPTVCSNTAVKVGTWDSSLGLQMSKDRDSLNLDHGMIKPSILVAATEGPPFVMKVTSEGVTKYEGFSIDILDELALKMRFNYTIVEPPDNFYGSPSEDGSWNGMVGMILRGEVEMAIGPITITPQRKQVIGFTTLFTEGSSGIITRSPGFEGGKSLFQILKPFSAEVWAAIGVAIVLMSFVSFLINRYTPYKAKQIDLQQDTETKTLSGNFWMMYASVMEQGVETHPHASSGRCVLGFWWVFTIVIVASYTANLTAVLTVFIPPSPISSLRQLLAQDEIQPIVQAGTSFETLFQNADYGDYRRIWKRLKTSPKIPLQIDIMELVKSGKYAYIADTPLLEYLAGQDCQTYSLAEESFDVVGYGMGIPKSAPYAERMNLLIIKMQQAGLIDKWQKRWWSSNGSCLTKGQSLPTRLGLDSLGGLFLLYTGAVVLSCTVFLAEIAVRKRKKT